MRDDRFNFVGRNKAALHAGRLALAQRRIQHIALADELFRAGRIQNDTRLNLAGYGKRDTGRNVGLHDAGDNIRRGSLGCDHQVHACGTGLLRDAADRGFDLLGGDHHQVGQLVDDNDNLRQYLILLRCAALLLLGLGALGAHQVVITDQIAHLMVGEQLVAAFHLADRPVERTRRLFRVGHDRNQQVRDAVIVAQLDHLGVDHNQAHLFGRGLVQKRNQHRVDAYGFTRTGGTGNQHMRHLGNIPDDRLAGDVLTNSKGQPAARVGERRRRDTLADEHGVDRLVRHLDTDGDFVRDGRDTHICRAE